MEMPRPLSSPSAAGILVEWTGGVLAMPPLWMNGMVPGMSCAATAGTVRPNEELNLTGGLRQQLARNARELHLIDVAGKLTPAR